MRYDKPTSSRLERQNLMALVRNHIFTVEQDIERHRKALGRL